MITFDGMKIDSIDELENANFPINLKYESSEKVTFLRFLQFSNAFRSILLIYEGIVTSSTSRLQKAKISN